MTTETLTEKQQTKSPIPRKLDETMITALSDLIRKGNYYHDACAIVEISEPCFYSWIKQAEQDEKAGLTPSGSIYLRLTKSILKARAEARAEFVGVIRESAVVKREFLPAVIFLERTDPAHWGRKDRALVEVVGAIQIQVKYDDDKIKVIEGEAEELET